MATVELTAGSAEQAVSAPPSSTFRLDIQAMRAVAVALVVVYHAWPWLLSGGYVGVDAFFVISGMLITSHLLREVDATGTVSLRRFWVRRARRLLPASLTTLAVVALAVLAWVPETLWKQYFSDIVASTFYVVNWSLATDSIDYFASENAPSPVQHFWSLSTEEQFYLIWPIVVVLASWSAARIAGRGRSRAGVAIALGLITLASLAYSIHLTGSQPTAAYFISPTRAWEFGVGALLAFVPGGALRLHGHVRSVLAVGGVTALIVTAFVFDDSTAFPGWIAVIPVAATAVVLLAGSTKNDRWSPMRLGAHGSVQFVGAISYSLYLWHWPLLVVAPFVSTRFSEGVGLAGVVGVSIVMAWLSLRLVEQPVLARPMPLRTAPTLGLTIVGMLLVTGIAVVGSQRVDRLARTESAQSASLESATCFGAAALDPATACSINDPDVPLRPTALGAKQDAVTPACMVGADVAALRVCEFGRPVEQAERVVALVGDSHAGHWRSTLDHLVDQQRWRLVTMLKGSCPFTTARRQTNDQVADSCEQWNAEVLEELGRRPEISMIFVSASSKNGFEPTDEMSGFERGTAGYLDAWSQVPPTVERIIALRDVPRPRPDNVDCLQALGSVEERVDYGACAVTPAEGLLPDPVEVAAATGPSRVTLVDVNDLLCDENWCFPVVGNSVVYRDGHHLTATFARTLAPYVSRRAGLDES